MATYIQTNFFKRSCVLLPPPKFIRIYIFLFSFFTYSSKFYSKSETLELRWIAPIPISIFYALHRDLHRLERWACANLMKSNKAKCKVLHMGQSSPKHKYRLDGE